MDPNLALGPDLMAYSYAWDNTGVQLPAGAFVPELDAMALTGAGPPGARRCRFAALAREPQAGMSLLLVVGWDAADWKIIDPLLADEEMPHLARVIAEGSAAITPLYSSDQRRDR
jgi:hypothetical protein